MGFGICAVYTLGAFLIYWDPTRLILARLKADSPYVFEKIHPKFKKTDPNSLITVTSQSELKKAKRRLIHSIWGERGLPIKKLPSEISKNFLINPEKPRWRPPSSDKKSFLALFDKIDTYKDLKNLKAIHRITITEKKNWTAHAGVFIPEHSNNRLVIYQNGFASTYHNQWRIIGDFIKRGFTVVAHNFRWYGLNTGTYNLKTLSLPLRGFFEPVIVSINFMKQRMKFKTIDLVGLSAGAWVSAIIAAVDERISRSYPVSGVSPMYLREGNEFPLPDVDALILLAANYLDIFVMGASGAGRGQTQIFNQFDRCCFRNQKNKLYENILIETTKSIGPGRFSVILDRSHARHKISRYAFNKILLDIKRDD